MELGNYTQPNAGYIQSIWLIPVQDVLGLEVSASDPGAINTISLADNADVVSLRFRRGSCSVAIDENDTVDGIVHMLAINMAIPRQADTLMDYMATRRGSRWLVGWADYNGQYWVGGHPENGLRLAISRQQAEQNQTQLKLTGRLVSPILTSNTYPGYTIGIPDFLAADFSDDFKI